MISKPVSQQGNYTMGVNAHQIRWGIHCIHYFSPNSCLLHNLVTRKRPMDGNPFHFSGPFRGNDVNSIQLLRPAQNKTPVV